MAYICSLVISLIGALIYILVGEFAIIFRRICFTCRPVPFFLFIFNFFTLIRGFVLFILIRLRLLLILALIRTSIRLPFLGFPVGFRRSLLIFLIFFHLILN